MKRTVSDYTAAAAMFLIACGLAIVTAVIPMNALAGPGDSAQSSERTPGQSGSTPGKPGSTPGKPAGKPGKPGSTPGYIGTWIPEPISGAPAGGGGGGGGMRGGGATPLTVSFDDTTMIVERGSSERPVKNTYRLDGGESINRLPGRGGEIETKSTVKVHDDRITIETSRPSPDGMMMTMTETWKLDGGNLVIERNTGRGPVKTVYRKGGL